eukprot:91968-Rhodomonas_salina.1
MTSKAPRNFQDSSSRNRHKLAPRCGAADPHSNEHHLPDTRPWIAHMSGWVAFPHIGIRQQQQHHARKARVLRTRDSGLGRV